MGLFTGSSRKIQDADGKKQLKNRSQDIYSDDGDDSDFDYEGRTIADP